MLAHGINEFIICCGYKGYMIKEYFANYFLHMSRRDLRHGAATRMEVHQQQGRALAGDPGGHGRGHA